MTNKFTVIRIIVLLSISTLLSSCYHTKNISYFQDFEKYQQGQASVQTPDNYQVRLQPDDELRIIVSTAINPEAAAPFNLSPFVAEKPSSSSASTNMTYQSYLIDDQGNVTIPSLGKVKVGGLTIEEAKLAIESGLKAYLKDPIVTLRLLNFRVNVLGEVTLPGPQLFERQKVTILDALAGAKDLTVYARRDSVKLIRDVAGKREYYVYDLTKSDFLSSPYFYLKPNDVIYVTPNKERQGDANVGTEKQYRTTLTTTIVSIGLGIVSTVATIFAITQ